MKKALTKNTKKKCWYFVEGEKIYGVHPILWGDVTDLWGDVTDLSGDASDLWGDVTGLRGNVTGLSGDVNYCEISDKEREEGVDVSVLVGE